MVERKIISSQLKYPWWDMAVAFQNLLSSMTDYRNLKFYLVHMLEFMREKRETYYWKKMDIRIGKIDRTVCVGVN